MASLKFISNTYLCYNIKMNQTYKTGLLKWTNLFFLIPFIVSFYSGIYWYSFIILVAFIVSFDYHFFNEAKQVYYIDVLFSSSLIFSNFVLLFLGHWALPYSIVAVVFALTALFFCYRKSKPDDYYFNHSLWHIFSAGICISCLVTYISFIK